jgi:hypothetical protein
MAEAETESESPNSGMFTASGVPGAVVNLEPECRTRASELLEGLEVLMTRLANDERLYGAATQLKTQLVDEFYTNGTPANNLSHAFSLHGPNESQLPVEVFQEQAAQQVNAAAFQNRTRLKVGRTLATVRELQNAYPERAELQELAGLLDDLDLDGTATEMLQNVQGLTNTGVFERYLQAKAQFLSDWEQHQESSHAQSDPAPFTPEDLMATMQALHFQERRLVNHPEVIRYKDYHYFRRFNLACDRTVSSLHTEFWGDDAMRQHFIDFVQRIRDGFPNPTPFFVFRFKDSFTYLLLGSPDDRLLASLAEQSEHVPVHAKLLLRQSNHAYRELFAELEEAPSAFHNCLKEATRPFVNQLNTQLGLELPEEFTQFFNVEAAAE